MKVDKEKAYDIIDNLENNKVDKKEIEVINYMLEVKKNLAFYLNSLIKSAVSGDSLQEMVKNKLIEQIPALNFDQLMRLYTILDKKQSITNDQLTALLKPTQNASSPLLDVFSDIKKEDKDDYTKAYDEMKPEDMRKMDKFSRTLEALTLYLEKEQKEKEEKNKDND